MVAEARSLEYTPTWIVAAVCSIIVLISLLAERGLHQLGKFLKRKHQDALYEALQKLKEELMLLGFISLLLTVFQSSISRICIPIHLASYMLPCKLETVASGGSGHNQDQYFQQTMTKGRRLLSTDTGSDRCTLKGKAPLLSLEALHQLHIFIFILALVHVIFCATTMVLGGARIRQWKRWEDSIRSEISKAPNAHTDSHIHDRQFFMQRAFGYWRKSVVISWMMSFFKQFYGSITKSDYVALRSGFIRAHCPSLRIFDFYEYMLRTLEVDFKIIVGISWYLWLFVVIFLLLDIQGWHTYFWLSFLPLVLLLLLGTKLEYIITRLAGEAAERKTDDQEAQSLSVKPSDEYFWVIVQVLCSYSTLPLYALVTQMGNMFKRGMFDDHVQCLLDNWATESQKSPSVKESIEDEVHIAEETRDVDQGITTSTIELSRPSRPQISLSP